MQPNPVSRTMSRIYLILVPLLVVALGFGLAPFRPGFYLPIWIVNAVVMVAAAWVLSVHQVRSGDAGKRHRAAMAALFVAPWVFISIFFGFGPPPATAAGWAAKALEQEVRYGILVLGGVFLAVAVSLLREQLKEAGEHFYSRIGLTLMMVAIPIYILNMIFWGSYLVKAQILYAASGLPPGHRPEWYLPVTTMFGAISTVEVGLLYLGTAAFAASLKVMGWFSPGVCRLYIILSLVGFVLNLLPPGMGEPYDTIGFVVSVPAIPFIMPYYMGVNFLWKAGKTL